MNKRIAVIISIFLLSLFIFQGVVEATKVCTPVGCEDIVSPPVGAIPCQTDADCGVTSTTNDSNSSGSVWEDILGSGDDAGFSLDFGEGAFTKVSLLSFGGVSGSDREAMLRFAFFMLLLIAIMVSLKKTGILGDNRAIEAIVALIISFIAVRMTSSEAINKFIADYSITTQIVYSLFWPLLIVILILLFTRDHTHRGLIYGVCTILIWWGLKEPIGLTLGILGHILILGFAILMIFSSLHTHGHLGEGYHAFKGLMGASGREGKVLHKSWRNWRQRRKLDKKEDKTEKKVIKNTKKAIKKSKDIEKDVKTRNWKKFMKDNQKLLLDLKYICKDFKEFQKELAQEFKRIRQEYKFTHTEVKVEGKKKRRLLQFKNPGNKSVKSSLKKDRKLTEKDIRLINNERRVLNRMLRAIQIENKRSNLIYRKVSKFRNVLKSAVNSKDGRRIYAIDKKLEKYEPAIYNLERKLMKLQSMKEKYLKNERRMEKILKKDYKKEKSIENKDKKKIKQGTTKKGKVPKDVISAASEKR